MARKVRAKVRAKSRRKPVARVRKPARRSPVRKPARKAAKKPAARARKPAARVAPKLVSPRGKLVGKVSHFYGNISVCVVDLTGPLKIGDSIAIQGSSRSFSQKVASMQVNHAPVREARAGESIGLKVVSRTREGDSVYRI